MQGTTIEIELYYEKDSQKTTAVFEWSGLPASPMQKTHRLVEFTKTALFAAEKTTASFISGQTGVSTIYIWAEDVNFINKPNTDNTPTLLVTDVTVLYPGLKNVIRMRKRVKGFKYQGNDVRQPIGSTSYHDEEISGLFE